MKGFARHERRWASDSAPEDNYLSAVSSPDSFAVASTEGPEEFVEVTLDVQEDDTIVLRSIEQLPSSVFHLDQDASSESCGSAASKSPSVRRSSSHKLRQFSHELKAEAMAKARQISQELKAELKRFSWSHGHAGRATGDGATAAIDSALAARAARKQRAQLHRTRSGAQKALRGLRFISTKTANGVDALNAVLSRFDSLAREGYLCRSDFAQCIGNCYHADSSDQTLSSFLFSPSSSSSTTSNYSVTCKLGSDALFNFVPTPFVRFLFYFF